MSSDLLAAWVQAGAAVVNLCVVALLTRITARYERSTAAISEDNHRLMAAAEESLRVSRTASYGAVYTWAADLLSERTAIEKRRLLFRELPEFNGSVFEMRERNLPLWDAFEDVCSRYDLVGIAGHNDMLPHGIVAKEWGNSIIELHEICAKYLAEYRAKRGDWFWNNFTELYREAKSVWR